MYTHAYYYSYTVQMFEVGMIFLFLKEFLMLTKTVTTVLL